MVRSLATAFAGVVVAVQGARISRKGPNVPVDTVKTLAGVPVLNYHTAYGGRSANGQREHWVVFAQRGVEDKTLEYLCESSGSCEMSGHPSEGGVPFFKVHSTEKELENILSLAPKDLQYVEPDGVVHIPEDNMEPEVAQAKSWGLDRIAASRRTATGRNTHIYVLDTGVRTSHRDFGGRAVPQLDVTSGTARECSSTDSRCARDRQGHGTHCAGTAGGREYGVAIGARLYGVKVLGDDGNGRLSWSYRALDWIASSSRARRPAVASMSLGSNGQHSGMKAAVDAAVGAGVTVVVAGGNDNSDACGYSPAFVDSAITVGSTTSSDQRSSFSNYGRCTDIWAPGSRITSAAHTSDTGATRMSGTSMACPHVSGAAAMVLQRNPSMTSDRVFSRLFDRAERNKISGLKSGDTNALLFVGF